MQEVDGLADGLRIAGGEVPAHGAVAVQVDEARGDDGSLRGGPQFKAGGILEEGKLRCVPGEGDAVAVDRNDAVGDFGSVREEASGECVAGRGG